MPRRNLSDAQKDAGNYRKPKVRVHGMEISVENPKGSIRSGVDRSGKPWAIRMTCAYGYFLGTKAGDGDHLDVFLGPDRSSELVFVVNQVRPATGEWDEHKVLLGFRTLAEAKAAYLSNYSQGWKGLGSIVPVTLPKFKAWAFSGKKLRDELPVDFRALLMPRLLTEFDKPFSGYTPSRHAKTGGLNDNFREKYNRENGSNLKRPVTKEPSKLDPNGKAAGRRKSFCGRMSGVPGPTSKDGKLTPKGAALKRWNCQSSQEATEFATPPRPVAKPKPNYMGRPLRTLKSRGLDPERAAADAWLLSPKRGFRLPTTKDYSMPQDRLTNLEARIGRLIDFATPTPRTNTQLLRTSRLNPLSMKKTGYGNEIMVAPKKLKGDAKSAAGYFADSSLPGRVGARDAIKEARSVAAMRLKRLRERRGEFTSARPTTDFSVDRSGGYVTIRDKEGNERKFRQPGLLNAIKRNPGKTAAAGTLAAGAAAYGLKRAFKK